ncbi:MAG: flagellar biosynthesis protein FlhB [Phycisphaeraceae bacterium]|nr:MAG: flagellar biosynthesis protein FlhB [Phycisphaeraceae bacterium]
MAEDLGEKTEDASSRKLADARENGRIAKSPDLAGAIDLAGGLILLAAMGALLWDGGGRLMRRVLGDEIGPEALLPGSTELVIRGAARELLMVAPFLGGAFLVAVLAHGLQVGPLWTTKPLVPKLDRLNPISGVKRLLSLRNVIKTLVNSVKLSAVLGVGAWLLVRDASTIGMLPMMGVGQALGAVGRMVLELSAWLILLMLVIGVADYMYQRWQHGKDLRMSKQEVKDERKNMDGDPEMKARRMRMARQLATQRAKNAVPGADVVVTNPTHFSVAIKYDGGAMRAPRVVAKGADHMALYIRTLARGAGVPILERPPLARALYYGVDVGREVPQEHYQAVAEVLAYVYRLKDRAATAAA